MPGSRQFRAFWRLRLVTETVPIGHCVGFRQKSPVTHFDLQVSNGGGLPLDLFLEAEQPTLVAPIHGAMLPVDGLI